MAKKIPDKYFYKHLVESISAKDKGMQALGYDCLTEVVDTLNARERKDIKTKWEYYFANDPEFEKLEKGKTTQRLQKIYEDKVKPLKMK